MASVNIQIKGLDKLQQGFHKAPSIIRSEVNEGIARSLAILDRRARKESPVDTGRLRASHRTEQVRSQMKGELFPTTDYAVFVHEKGTTRRWRGNPWLDRTALGEQREVERTMQDAIDQALTKAF